MQPTETEAEAVGGERLPASRTQERGREMAGKLSRDGRRVGALAVDEEAPAEKVLAAMGGMSNEAWREQGD